MTDPRSALTELAVGPTPQTALSPGDHLPPDGRAHHVSPPAATPPVAPPEAGGETPTRPRKRRPKDIGTADETAVVRALRRHGFPHAERRALRGHKDAGDILVCPGIIAESKGGAAGRNASDGQVLAWLNETETERINAGAAHAFLILPRNGIGPANAGRWWAVIWVSTLLDLHATPWATTEVSPWHDAPLRIRLDQLCVLLVNAGYGSLSDGETL